MSKFNSEKLTLVATIKSAARVYGILDISEARQRFRTKLAGSVKRHGRGRIIPFTSPQTDNNPPLTAA